MKKQKKEKELKARKTYRIYPTDEKNISAKHGSVQKGLDWLAKECEPEETDIEYKGMSINYKNK